MQDLSEHSNVLSLIQVVQDLEHHSKKSHHGTHHSRPSAGIKQLQRKRRHE